MAVVKQPRNKKGWAGWKISEKSWKGSLTDPKIEKELIGFKEGVPVYRVAHNVCGSME